MIANARSVAASVSSTWFLSAPRESACDVTAVYWDSRAQDRSTSVDAIRGTPLIVTAARR